MPGMLRHGVVVATPHYVTRSGPRTKVDPELVDAWHGYDARTALAEAFGLPTLVLNDAEVHGAGVVAGTGCELILTLGTGLGCALFDGGKLAPHLEMSQAPVRWGMSYDTYIGEHERRRLGDALWSRRWSVSAPAVKPCRCVGRGLVTGRKGRCRDGNRTPGPLSPHHRGCVPIVPRRPAWPTHPA